VGLNRNGVSFCGNKCLAPQIPPEAQAAPEAIIPAVPSIPLTWNLPLHIEAGDGARLAELFARVWERIPAVGRQNLLLAWVGP
jgi:hypothetical protein